MLTRILVVAVALGSILSALVLGAMLAAPFLPDPAARAGSPSATPGATVIGEPSAPADLPPLGLFQMRDAWFAIDRCLAIELRPESYPVGDPELPGRATVISWPRGIVDPGHPDACSVRSGDLEEVDAEVFRVFGTVDDGRGDPTETVVAYALHFPFDVFGIESDLGLTILARQSTQDVLQVTNTLDPGSGLVFDRVESVDPPLVSPPPS